MKIVEPQNTIEIIKKNGFSFKKNFGQNFLIDERVLTRIVEAADISKGDHVLEIGPGIGTMTQAMAEAAGRVTAVEIDSRLIPILEENLAGYDNVSIINADVLKTDIAAIAAEGGVPLKVVANLPYYITTPIVMGLLEQDIPVKSITVMIQKEVAERMSAGPGTKDYGALSLAVQYYTEPHLIANVPPNCFIPRPGVGSAVIRLDRYEEPPVKVSDPKMMFRLIQAAFGQRRKTLVNTLIHRGDLGLTRERVLQVLREMGLPEAVRGEALTLEQFAELTDRLAVS